MKKIVNIIFILFIIISSFCLVSCKETSGIDSYTLYQQMNDLLNEYETTGKKQALEDKWFDLDSTDNKIFNFDSLENINGTLRVGTLLICEPFAYLSGENYTGICFEYIYDLCVKHGYNIKISTFSSFSGLLAAIQSNKIDLGADSISITEERMESVSFTDPFMNNEIICIKRFDDESINSKGDLTGKTVGILTGSTLGSIVTQDNSEAILVNFNSVTDYVTALANDVVDCAYMDSTIFKTIQKQYPNIVKAYTSNSDDQYAFLVKKFGYQTTSELKNTTIGILDGSVYESLAEEVVGGADTAIYKDIPSLVLALKSGKIQSFIVDKSLVNEAKKENSGIYTFNKSLVTAETGAVFPKTEEGNNLRLDFNDFIYDLQSSGKLDQLINKWENYVEGVTESELIPNLTGTSKILKVSICATMCPYTFMEGSQYTGLEIEIMKLYANSRGYYIIFENMEWGSLMSSLNKNDMAISCIIKTDERAESVYFSETLFNSDVVFVSMCNNEKNTSIFNDIGNSFYKTFIKESRWKLFVEGALVTLLITFASCVIGLIFGFILYLLADRLGVGFKTFIKYISAILNYIPVVVILMIFYYIIFGKSSISSIIVSIIVFGILFALSTYSMITTCVMAVDKGQYEAAYSLGYSKNKTFFKVILPQTLQQFLSLLKSELVTHLKATAIVGYIAVEDLTKMSDIVRSRTYESFFPLICTAIIYFILAFLLITLVKRINIHIDPKRRSAKKILKGVKTND